MSDLPTREQFIQAAARHLPPSAAELRLLDVGQVAEPVLSDLRDDLSIQPVSLHPQHWGIDPDTVDAVIAYDRALAGDFLRAVLAAMRPGGRLIIVNPMGTVDEEHVRRLEQAGYTRILVESAVAGQGVLIRGEKPHTTGDTHARVQRIAGRDADELDLRTYRGRYLHLLVRQHPNKPAWRREPDEPVTWQAAACRLEDGTLALLAFSSLPKAVGFMQPAVLQGFVRDINKVGKFSREAAQAWEQPVLLNPTLAGLQDRPMMMIDIDPETAEAPDE